MAKKYLTLEEAAARLSLTKDALVKLREEGSIRGFADRGNWKFKVDDVEELARSRQADSDPDVRIESDPAGSGVLDEESRRGQTGDSSFAMATGDSTTHAQGGGDFGEGLDGSDSDVSLVADTMLPTTPEDSDSDINLVADADSDSDVMLVADSDSDSDSDVKLVESQSDSDSDINLMDTSDSDIQLASSGGSISPDDPTDSEVALVSDLADSDSDIRLSADHVEDLGGTDSDVRLVADDPGSDITLSGPEDLGSDSDVRLVAEQAGDGSDSDVQLIDSAGADSKTSDSDIALISSDDSAIAIDLDDPEDGSSVLTHGSDIKLQDSSMTLGSGSGISLEGPTDSGISLDLDFDEGITLAEDDDSGISIADGGDSGIALASGDDDVAETQFEIPSLRSDESEFDIPAADEGDTSVIDLDDDSGDQTAMLDVMGDSGELDDAVFDVDDADSAEIDALSDELELDDDFDDDSDMDVFEDDGDFEEGFQSGESHGEFVVPTRAAAIETDWGTGIFSALIASTSLLVVLGIMMADLIRSMWSWNEPSLVASPLLDFFAGLL